RTPRWDCKAPLFAAWLRSRDSPGSSREDEATLLCHCLLHRDREPPGEQLRGPVHPNRHPGCRWTHVSCVLLVSVGCLAIYHYQPHVGTCQPRKGRSVGQHQQVRKCAHSELPAIRQAQQTGTVTRDQRLELMTFQAALGCGKLQL